MSASAALHSLAGTRVHFYGLGELGFHLARRLQAAGANVFGFDTDPQAQARWQAAHASEPVLPPHVVVLCVTHEAASRNVIDQRMASWMPGTLVIEHGTVSPQCARETASRCTAAGLRYVDAPLSGGAEGAQRGTLVAMLGAEPHDHPAVLPVLSAYCAHVESVGIPGDGQTCKLANQLAIAGIAAGLAVAQRFALANGLNLDAVFNALSHGSAHSVQLERLKPKLCESTVPAAERFAWLHKDLEHCAEVSIASQPLVQLWRALWDTPSTSFQDSVS
jgi:3-hydroxyisobutyrate dehydrogenase